MTFPLDPGLRAFQAQEAERTLLVDPSAQPVPPAGFQAEDGERPAVTPPRPADDGASRPA
jgi:hypothetical protein